ncbi:NAD(P)-dependent dehydrogenase (short-subunit alcohol dehydrogenase family) [Bradyrhizobium sp. cir1]|uniref:SDR family NAD(P)-dependent oxidoreductase n=1 Tax=Bradyrhizobium sp. cir1 TaxID=1445730 RepID=UPI001606DC06|nr:SDR family NAD(P)-dependent oxidoreductase [Bradyrhizobium sp. cir1]MBB4375130.1 NAD(P)-dependent dehydrogenase (short-subunit alcohol dehydrogenase family) [Bradyrhizobium sp. cir1]
MDYALPNFSIDLNGQTAIVTGASAGLGVRFAKTLARCGARVALTARRFDRLESVAAEIKAAGGDAVPLQLDVTDADQLTRIVADAERQLGPITILVNNAGVPDAQRATKMSIDLIDRVLDTNVRAPYVLSCEVARRLIAAKRPGRIVNIASSSAYFYGGNGAALYSISKAAVVRMTEALAVEWAKFNINVNAIAPGAFSSEMIEGMLQRVGDITQGFPRPRIGDPAQLDSTLLFLVSPSSDFVTGTCVRVDDVQTGR